MQPSAIFEVLSNDTELSLAGITEERIYESQSLDSRPHSDGYFITINMEETTFPTRAIYRGPRTITVAVHHPMDIDRDYSPLTRILTIVTRLLRTLPGTRGSDGIHITSVDPQGRSANMVDEGWETITRSQTYGVLYDETAA